MHAFRAFEYFALFCLLHDFPILPEMKINIIMSVYSLPSHFCLKSYVHNSRRRHSHYLIGHMSINGNKNISFYFGIKFSIFYLLFIKIFYFYSNSGLNYFSKICIKLTLVWHTCYNTHICCVLLNEF